MAFRDEGHRLQVFATPQYRTMVREYVRNGSPVPLAIFQENYGRAFWDRSGNPIYPGRTATSRTAFLNTMRWTGRAGKEVETWEDWIEYNGYE